MVMDVMRWIHEVSFPKTFTHTREAACFLQDWIRSFMVEVMTRRKPREEKKERIELISFDSKLQTMIIFASCTCMKTESLPDKIFRASCQSETAMKLPSWILTSIERQNRVRFAASIPLSEANNEWRLESNRKALPK